MSSMKQNWIKFALSMAFLGVFAAPALAQEIKIGVVNLQFIVQNAPQTKAVMATLEEEFAPRQREVAAKQKEIEDLQGQLQKNASVMSQTELTSADKELRGLQRDLQRLGAELQEDATLRQNEELDKLQRTLFTEVRTYAEAQGYDLVLTEGVLYASNAINITEGAFEAVSANHQAAAAQ